MMSAAGPLRLNVLTAWLLPSDSPKQLEKVNYVLFSEDGSIHMHWFWLMLLLIIQCYEYLFWYF